MQMPGPIHVPGAPGSQLGPMHVPGAPGSQHGPMHVPGAGGPMQMPGVGGPHGPMPNDPRSHRYADNYERHKRTVPQDPNDYQRQRHLEQFGGPEQPGMVPPPNFSGQGETGCSCTEYQCLLLIGFSPYFFSFCPLYTGRLFGTFEVKAEHADHAVRHFVMIASSDRHLDSFTRNI